jgi:hypothetical protein
MGGGVQCPPFSPMHVPAVGLQTGLGHCQGKLSAVQVGQDGKEMVSKLPTGKRNGRACATVSRGQESRDLASDNSFLDECLAKSGTDPGLQCCIIKYARGHGYKTKEEVCRSDNEKYKIMALEQDKLSWRRFMEGMLLESLVSLQEEYHCISGEGLATRKWASQLVIQLLEVVHGQWVYHNIQVHAKMKSTLCTEDKGHLLREIEIEMALGFDGFFNMKKSLAMVALEDMEASGGESQVYWLIAMQTVQAAKALADGLAAADTMPD